jgi:iron complex transport system ATP-binding protein
MSLLQVRDLHVVLAKQTVIGGVSLSVEPGEIVGLIGPNGAGKTTLMKAAQGLLPRQSGTIALAGHDLERLTSADRARQLAWLPQEREIAWPIAVGRLVALGRLPHHGGSDGNRQSDRHTVERAMQQANVAHLASRPATALSGGERARVLLARALAQEAPLLLADEPAAGLDPGHQIDLMQTLRTLADAGNGVLVSMHDLGLAARWCDRLLLLERGQILADGPPEAVLTTTRLRTAYGIEAVIQADETAGLTITPLHRTPRHDPNL